MAPYRTPFQKGVRLAAVGLIFQMVYMSLFVIANGILCSTQMGAKEFKMKHSNCPIFMTLSMASSATVLFHALIAACLYYFKREKLLFSLRVMVDEHSTHPVDKSD